MHIFYVEDAGNAGINSIVNLDPEETAHCVKVLRLTPGEKINIIDGKNHIYQAELTLCAKNTCTALIQKEISDVYRRTYRNHVAIAPTKNIDRFEWFVEKAVEFGIDEITPLLCEHSERKILKTERLNKIIISAVKQSGNLIAAKLNELTPIDDFFKSVNESHRFIAHCEDNEKQFFGDVCSASAQTVTLIGPEGDFSGREIEKAMSLNFLPVSLGNTRLRTETAGVSVCAYLACINNKR